MLYNGDLMDLIIFTDYYNPYGKNHREMVIFHG